MTHPKKSRQSLVLLGFAGLALLCAIIGALGPAERAHSRFSWPPNDLPAAQPERLWHTPLP